MTTNPSEPLSRRIIAARALMRAVLQHLERVDLVDDRPVVTARTLLRESIRLVDGTVSR